MHNALSRAVRRTTAEIIAGTLVIGFAPVGRAASDGPPQKSAAATTQPTTAQSVHLGNLHNVFEVFHGLISGSAPESDADFAALRDAGVRTIISVDGTTPDAQRAAAQGLRYVHFPIGYHGMEPSRRLEIARAIRDLPGPAYIHCHHGKHRGPAAAAAAAVILGKMTPEQGVAFIKAAGTDPCYPGLFRCVSDARPAGKADIDGAPADFPTTAPVPGFVQAMTRVQETLDHLAAIRDAGWTTPRNHPDLVPLSEAGMLENYLRSLRKDTENSKRPAEFQDLLSASHKAATDFEAALRAGKPAAELATCFKTLSASCKACHTRFRDNR